VSILANPAPEGNPPDEIALDPRLLAPHWQRPGPSHQPAGDTIYAPGQKADAAYASGILLAADRALKRGASEDDLAEAISKVTRGKARNLRDCPPGYLLYLSRAFNCLNPPTIEHEPESPPTQPEAQGAITDKTIDEAIAAAQKRGVEKLAVALSVKEFSTTGKRYGIPDDRRSAFLIKLAGLNPACMAVRSTVEQYVEALTGSILTPMCWRVLPEASDEKERVAKFDAKQIEEGKFPARRNYDGTIADVWDRLVEHNIRKWAVYVVVNAGGRDAESIRAGGKIRALYIDGDGIPLPEHWHAKPDFLVIRDATHWHAYWLVSDCPVEAFRTAQRRLIAFYGTDPSIHDLPRILRIPGTWHQKSEPILVRFEQWVCSTTNSKMSWLACPKPPRSRRRNPVAPGRAQSSSRNCATCFRISTRTCLMTIGARSYGQFRTRTSRIRSKLPKTGLRGS